MVWEIDMEYEGRLSVIAAKQLEAGNKRIEIKNEKVDAENGNMLQGVTLKTWKQK